MLKRNLVKNGFFGYGLFLLLPNMTAVRGESLNPFKNKNASPVEITVKSDSLGTPQSGEMIANISSTEPAVKKLVSMPQVSLNKNATKFVKSYLVKEEESLRKVKNRSKAYFKMMDTIFTKYGLPLELKYLAVIESDLNSTALSKVGARGMWQLMPGTARELGLKVSKKYDERTHVYKSTVAAALYLRDLYAQFGDWLLVLAAYNGGPGVVIKAINRSGSKNFWALQNYLPMESRGHVKRFIGTHYYFEGKGSITTLTKAEANAYNKIVKEFKAIIAAEKELEKNTAVAEVSAARL